MSGESAALSRFAGWLLRHRLLVLLFWVLVMVGGVVAAPVVNDEVSGGNPLPGRPGYEANTAILQTYGTGGDEPLVPVITLPAGQSADAAKPEISRAFAAVAEKVKGRVVSYGSTSDQRLVSPDGRSTFGLVFLPPGGSQDTGASRAVEAAMRPALPAGSTVQVTGIGPLSGLEEQSAAPGITELTLVGAALALAVLIFVFASFLALTPLVVAAVSIFAIFLALWAVLTVADVHHLVVPLVALLGLGVAIDYSLLIVTRWREERHRGHSDDEAVRRTVATAGRAVLLSGLTVAFGLLALVVLPVPSLRSVGYSSMLIPLISAAVAVTLLPVLLSRIGRVVDWPRLRKETSASRGWTAWARGVVRLRWVAAIVGIAVLAVLAGFAPSLSMGSPASGSLATSGPAYEGLRTLRSAQVPSGVLTPIEVLVPPGTDPSKVAEQLAQVDGVWDATAPADPMWRQGETGLVAVLPDAEAGTDAGRATIESVRAVAADLPGVRVGGVGAQDIDYGDAVYGNLPLLLGLVSLIAFVLLLRAFRSVFLAIKAVLIDLLSIAAAIGAIVLVWQRGYGSEAIWGIPATGAVDTGLPLIVFGFLFGLSMDYEIFLLSRMREEYDRTGSTVGAVVEGVGRTGRLVTSAALILFFALAALAAVPGTEFKIFASALAVGVLLDATVVRAFIVPAIVVIFGRWSWALPSWLRRLLRVG